MANYVFEQTTAEQAAGFTANDFLIFTTATTNAVNISVTSAGASGLNNSSVTLTAGGKSLTFPQAAIATASQQSHIVFNDSSRLVLGDESANAATVFFTAGNNGPDGVAGTADDVPATNSGVDVFYGFGGNDTLDGGTGNDYLYGGFGVDSIVGGAGNDHIYGNSLNSAQGALDASGNPDGGDIIAAGTGNDYVNGNAGADSIDGGAGNDRLFGGSGNDTILGSDGTDTIQGNQGNDSIDGGTGNDVLRGGQGNDFLFGGTTTAAVVGPPAVPAVPGGNDILYGDVGNDTLQGGDGFDVLFGGTGVAGADTAGANVFLFNAGDSLPTNIGQTGALANVTDIVADYNDGVDKIDLAITLGATSASVLTGEAQTSLSTALLVAQGLLDNTAAANNTEVVALNVNGVAYLFAAQGSGVDPSGNAANNANTIDTVIRFEGVNASVFNTGATAATSDFI